ncbi:MAG: amino acid transporter [Myxococcaceae bacterium]|nr:amino acid transporter [Myxococcaceae bacterium]
MGGFSTFAISFSIISVVTGVITTYGTAISSGGPAALGIGWPLVSVGTMIVALAMAEVASAFPTAGALYHWSSLLGGPGWGWFTAMLNLTGQCAIVAAIDFGCAQSVVSTFGRERLVVPLFLVILFTHAIINAFGVRLVAWLNSFSATVHIVGVVVIVGALLVFGRAKPFTFVFETGFTTRPDGRWALGFINALVLGTWTFTGYDASAHVSEETHDPARRAPWGIVSSVGVSAVAGYALVIALTLAIKDMEVARAAQPALEVMTAALGHRAGVGAMLLASVAMWFCGLSSVTSFSRTLYAFSRDDGLPGSHAIRAVHRTYGTPLMAVLLSVLLPAALVIVTVPLSDSVFLAVASLATTGLYVSYALPIGLGAVARIQGRWNHRGPFQLGRFGVPIAFAAVLWAIAVLGICSLPPNWTAGAMLAVLVVVLVIVYLAFVRGRFKGPKVTMAAMEKAIARST